MRRTPILALAAAALLAGAQLASAPAHAALGGVADDYPTEARADYVFGCMAANGQTHEALHECSCSIDVISSILPYDNYVDAETVLSMRQGVGIRANAFKGIQRFNDMVANLRRAQAEGEIRCFK